MFKENPFDPVFDCQQVFKTLMNALARPGTIVSREKNVEKLEGENAALLAAGLALLDNWRRFCVCGDPQLEKELRELTYGVPDVLSEADYLFLTKEQTAGLSCREILEEAKAGTLAEPHKSATLFLMLDALTGGEPCTLSGPGINGNIQISLPQEGRRWIEARQQIGYEFPCGIELYFLTPQGELMGVPRKIKLKGNN